MIAPHPQQLLKQLEEERNQLKANNQALLLQLNEQESALEEVHELTCRLNISSSPDDLAQLCLTGIKKMIPAESHLIWFANSVINGGLNTDGPIPFFGLEFMQLLARLPEHDWNSPLIKNRIAETSLGVEFPRLRNFILSPIPGAKHHAGWLFSCNLPAGQEFGSSHFRLFKMLSFELSTQLQNLHLAVENQDLVLGVVRSLVAILDAKDPYTCGHSDRVAIIAQELARTMQIGKQEQNWIYLAGILHDIGKLGVNDYVLQKTTGLNAEEIKQIQQHPMIGYNFLKEIPGLKPVLPGIRNHHEKFNGTGYPDKLKGEEIPLVARIIAVADSYDAMQSNRAYRDGLSLEAIESIFSEDAGNQWDPKVIEAYFKSRDLIAEICQYEHHLLKSPLHDSPEDMYTSLGNI